MSAAAGFDLLAFCLVAACAGDLPNSAVPDNQAGRYYSAVSAATPITALIDDRVFYVGSDNLYPVNLQEFGYIVDDGRAAMQLRDAYWNPL